jgi:hypothetical protein
LRYSGCDSSLENMMDMQRFRLKKPSELSALPGRLDESELKSCWGGNEGNFSMTICLSVLWVKKALSVHSQDLTTSQKDLRFLQILRYISKSHEFSQLSFEFRKLYGREERSGVISITSRFAEEDTAFSRPRKRGQSDFVAPYPSLPIPIGPLSAFPWPSAYPWISAYRYGEWRRRSVLTPKTWQHLWTTDVF